MYVVDEKDRQYRYGDHGPKYLMQGPRSSFGICQLKPVSYTHLTLPTIA